MNSVYTLEGGEELSKSQFLSYVEKKVRKTIRVFDLIDKKEKIVVGVSGGKDSAAVLYLLNKIIRNKNVSIEAIHIDHGIGNHSKISKEKAIELCKNLDIPLTISSFREEYGMSLCYIKAALHKQGVKRKSCNICSSLRRFLINKLSKDLGATKVVLGHNLDDEAETVMMNMFNNQIELLARLGPKPGLVKFSGFVQRIKPLYMVKEDEVKLFSQLLELPVHYKACPCSIDSYRRSVLNMLNDFDGEHVGTKYGIVNSYLEMMPMLKEKYSAGIIAVCSSCGSASAGGDCRACKIISMIKNKEQPVKVKI